MSWRRNAGKARALHRAVVSNSEIARTPKGQPRSAAFWRLSVQ